MLYTVLSAATLLAAAAAAAARFPAFKDDLAEPPQPYTFGYKVHGKDGDQWRSEASDGHGKVRGSYGYVDNGGMQREVRYVADHDGFRAKVTTNEPGMKVPNPADVILEARDAPPEFEAKVYGVEAVPPPLRAAPPARRFFSFHRFAEESAPPVYVVDGSVQSPWFPMEDAALLR